MSEFSSAGYDTFPSIYADTQRIHEFGALERDVLETKLKEYLTFLERDDLMPRARAESERLKTHLMFELCYRDGLFEDAA